MPHRFWSSEEYDDRAHDLYNSGDFDGALETLKEGLALYPNSVDLYVGLGYARLAREEFAWARRAFERAMVLDSAHEDAMVGMGEVLLRMGQIEEGLRLFRHVESRGFDDDVELMLTMGRALYREGLYPQARNVFAKLAAARPDCAEAAACVGYTVHRLGDEVAASRQIRRALRVAPDLHEARVYLGHLLYDRGDGPAALREYERVPPSENWDLLALYRLMELKQKVRGWHRDHPSLAPWQARIAELQRFEDDPVEQLLAEVEARFHEDGSPWDHDESQLELFEGGVPFPDPGQVEVRLAGRGAFRGSWLGVVQAIRDDAGFGHDRTGDFMRRMAERWHEQFGVEVPATDPESFLRGAAAAGLLDLEILDDPVV